MKKNYKTHRPDPDNRPNLELFGDYADMIKGQTISKAGQAHNTAIRYYILCTEKSKDDAVRVAKNTVIEAKEVHGEDWFIQVVVVAEKTFPGVHGPNVMLLSELDLTKLCMAVDEKISQLKRESN